MKNTEFVDQTVNELIVSGCAIEVPFQPYIVNPLQNLIFLANLPLTPWQDATSEFFISK
jgi:hypothetical protein